VAIRKWDPFKDLVTLHNNLNRIFEVRMNPSSQEMEISRVAWTPAADFYARDDALVLLVELPGLEREDIALEVKDRVLLVSGERRFTRDVKEEHYHRIERSYGKFQRSFSLPFEVDRDDVQATYRNGVLEVTLPRTRPTAARKIVVETE
jgi:HSP20 family protein